MRYFCDKCHKHIKDKFIFGLLHVCRKSAEEIRRMNVASGVQQAKSPEELISCWSEHPDLAVHFWKGQM